MTATRSDAVATWHEPSPVPLRGTLALLPGRGESPEVYQRFGRRLAADAYRVHVVAAATESAELAAEQVEAILADADQATPRVLVGSDAGAAYAAHLVARGRLPGVSALILAGLPTSAAADAVAGDWDAELDLRTSCPTHRGRISEGGVRPGQLFDELAAEWLDPATPGLIAVPTLGVHGRDDAVSPVAAARRWYAAVPKAELVSIAGGRHDVLNDQTHRTVAATIVLFLERLRAGADLAPLAVAETLGSLS